MDPYLPICHWGNRAINPYSGSCVWQVGQPLVALNVDDWWTSQNTGIHSYNGLLLIRWRFILLCNIALQSLFRKGKYWPTRSNFFLRHIGPRTNHNPTRLKLGPGKVSLTHTSGHGQKISLTTIKVVPPLILCTQSLLPPFLIQGPHP